MAASVTDDSATTNGRTETEKKQTILTGNQRHRNTIVIGQQLNRHTARPYVPELKEMFPTSPYIARPGQINAWDNEEFLDAVKKTGKKH